MDGNLFHKHEIVFPKDVLLFDLYIFELSLYLWSSLLRHAERPFIMWKAFLITLKHFWDAVFTILWF